MSWLKRKKASASTGDDASTEGKGPDAAADGLAEEGGVSPNRGEAGRSRDEVRERVCAFLIELSEDRLEMDLLEFDAHILDYGYIDSFNAVRLIGMVKEEYGVTIDEVELVGRLSTLDAIAAHVAEK